MVAEGGGEFGEPLTGGVEGLLLLPLQAHAPQLHVPQFRRQDAALGGIELAGIGLQRFESPIDRPRLPSPVAELDNGPLLLLVGLPQGWCVADAIEMAHHPPAPAQPLAKLVQRLYDLLPAE